MGKCIHIIPRDDARHLGMQNFFTGTPCKHGHVSERRVSNNRCIQCEKTYTKAYYENNYSYYQEYRDERKDKVSEYGRDYYKKNRIRIMNRTSAYYEENREEQKKSRKKHYEKNKEAYKIRSRNRENRVKDTAEYKISKKYREMVRRALKCAGMEKEGSTEEYLGYTTTELKVHIESLFLEGMSWDNYGEWHIDHIYPISRFISEGVTDTTIINALSNLRPMWAEDNISKGSLTLEEWKKINPIRAILYD